MDEEQSDDQGFVQVMSRGRHYERKGKKRNHTEHPTRQGILHTKSCSGQMKHTINLTKPGISEENLRDLLVIEALVNHPDWEIYGKKENIEAGRKPLFCQIN